MAPPHLQSSTQGVRTIFSRLGGLAGSVGGGLVLQNFGPHVMYRGAALGVALSGAAFFSMGVMYPEHAQLMRGSAPASSGSSSGRPDGQYSQVACSVGASAAE